MSELVRKGDASRAHWTGTTRATLILGCLVLPWVNPFTWGPSATVVPWLVSAACAVLLWGFLMPADASQQPPGWWAKRVADGWLVAALVSCVIGLVQYFGLTADLGPLMSGSATGEAFGNLRQRNQFATLTMLGMAVVLWRVSLDSDDVIAWPAAVLLAVANAASASRTGLLQLLMLAAFCALWQGPHVRRRLALCLAAGIAYCAAALLLPVLLEAATGVTAPSIWGRIGRQEGCSSRLVLWSNVLHLIAERPWAGWGWGELDYAHYFTLYPGARFCDILDNAHNLPLHLAVELGIPAATVICVGFLWWVVRAKAWREADATRQLAWSALAVILLHSMLEYPLWYGPFQIAFVIGVGLLQRPSPAAAANAVGQERPATFFRWGLALALLAALAVNAWDYHRVSQIYLPPEARAADYRDDTLARIRDSRLFPNQVRFAELTITPLTRENAQWTFDTALAMLHFSPEQRVIEKVIESAIVLGRDAEAATHLARFRAAFPAEYKRWSASRERVPAGAIKD